MPVPRSPRGKRVAMMVLNDVRLDSRVKREAEALSVAGYRVTVYGVLTPATLELADEVRRGYRIRRLPMLTRPQRADGASAALKDGRKNLTALRMAAGIFQATRPLFGGTAHFAANLQLRWRRWARRVASAAEPADIWHAHDFNALPAALACAQRHGGEVIYDSHEIFSEAGSAAALPRLVRRLIRWQESRWVARCDAIITVNHAIADVLAKELRPRRAHVVHNCATPRGDARPSSHLRRALGLSADVPLALYHGSVVQHRGLLEMVKALRDDRLGDLHFAVMGYGPLRDDVVDAARAARLSHRVHLLPPVDPDVLIEWVAGADVAVMPLQPSTLNHQLSTPNKLFEALAAGVPVVGPSYVTFEQIVNDPQLGPLGALCDPRSSQHIADSVASLLALRPADRHALRERCLAAARTRWNWAAEATTLVGLYNETLVAAEDRSSALDRLSGRSFRSPAAHPDWIGE